MSERPFTFIAGPCVLENTDVAIAIARELQEATADLDVDFVFKGSFDKANRTSVDSFRGPGMTEGLSILKAVKDELGLKVLSDIHTPDQAGPAAEVLDILQIPAFLCRQTDLVVEAAKTGKKVNIKKAQFVAPEDMQYTIGKAESTGNKNLMLTERGTTFGYHNLVVDFRSFSVMRSFGYPVIFDATHAVQIPSQGGKSAGNREYVPHLARAAAAYGIDGLFCEVYPDPDQAKCDAANSIAIADVRPLLETILAICNVISS